MMQAKEYLMKTTFPLARPLAAAAVACAVALAAPAAPAQQVSEPATPPSFAGMVALKLPAVVGILSTVAAPPQGPGAMPQLPPGLEEFFGIPLPDQPPPGPMQGQGSGFIISADGFVVTNAHVVEGAEEVEVMLEDGRRLPAEIVGADPATDIALLRIEAGGDLPTVAWGSSDDLEIGDWVVAIGNPFGLGGTVTAGIVSARSRNLNAGPYDDFIQTDAAINRGNSGGPLFDASGRVVGVNTAIFSPTGGSVGIGFAVPSSVAERIVADLRDDGQVERGWLGVQIQPLDDEIAAALGFEETAGALIAAVEPGSPADAAGLRPGLVITALNGVEVEAPRDLVFAVADLDVGSEATLTVRSGLGETEEVIVTIGAQPALRSAVAEPEAMGQEGARLGVSVEPLSPDLRAQLGISDAVEGLAISAVRPGSPAAEAGLGRGDVIVEAGGAPVADAAALGAAASAAEDEGRPLLLRVLRNGSYTFLAVPLGGG
jgi:serine protease Do